MTRHIRGADFTYICIACGIEKNDSEFEDSGNSEVCKQCEAKND